jgi:hypothetical protein
VNLLPIIRRGITASPLQINYSGRPTFLIDASVFGGSSGSPVFLYNNGTYTNRSSTNVMVVGGRLYCLGILAEVHARQDYQPLEFVTITTTQTPAIKTTQMLDLGIVFKSA